MGLRYIWIGLLPCSENCKINKKYWIHFYTIISGKGANYLPNKSCQKHRIVLNMMYAILRQWMQCQTKLWIVTDASSWKLRIVFHFCSLSFPSIFPLIPESSSVSLTPAPTIRMFLEMLFSVPYRLAPVFVHVQLTASLLKRKPCKFNPALVSVESSVVIGDWSVCGLVGLRQASAASWLVGTVKEWPTDSRPISVHSCCCLHCHCWRRMQPTNQNTRWDEGLTQDSPVLIDFC